MPFDDGFFNDPFEDIIRDFFGDSRVRKRKSQFIKGEEEDRTIDFIEDKKKVYLVFELPGYDEKDVSIIVKGRNLEITAKKAISEDVQEYLSQKLKQGISIQKKLPDILDSKSFSHTLKNGVLEMVFEKNKNH